eukprot:TRINITY_DN2193_c0_g1_i5.p1 TRINITY_DN2193_c0_g1~~TRINITY_DN2193_c0_g1_i5.p1  ORF type:complete len:585 (+),score=81.62 TRINITY_DN2193_c0_g1_i5:247-1755(+)
MYNYLDFSPNQAILIFGGVVQSRLGDSVIFTKSINNDTVDDIIIATRFKIVYVVYGTNFNAGSMPIQLAQAFNIAGTASFNFGVDGAVATCDLNNDSFIDIIVGCRDCGNGSIYIIFGSSNPQSSIIADSRLTLIGSNNMGQFISTGGDFNGDGIDDVVFGSPTNDGGIFLYYGSLTQTLSGQVNLSSLSLSQGFPVTGMNVTSLSLGGDYNVDGLADIMVGSSAEQNRQGVMRIINGTQNNSIFSISSIQTLQINGPTVNADFGAAVWSKPYRNERVRVLVGASIASGGLGQVYVQLLPNSATSAPTPPPTTIPPTLLPTSAPTTITTIPTTLPTLSTIVPTILPPLIPTGSIITIVDEVFYGNLSLSSGSVLSFEDDDASLNVGGCISLNGTLILNLDYLNQTNSNEFQAPIRANCFLGEFQQVNITGLDRCRSVGPIQQGYENQQFVLIFDIKDTCNGLTGGAIAGIVLAVVALCLIIVAIIFLVPSIKKKVFPHSNVN